MKVFPNSARKNDFEWFRKHRLEKHTRMSTGNASGTVVCDLAFTLRSHVDFQAVHHNKVMMTLVYTDDPCKTLTLFLGPIWSHYYAKLDNKYCYHCQTAWINLAFTILNTGCSITGYMKAWSIDLCYMYSCFVY